MRRPNRRFVTRPLVLRVTITDRPEPDKRGLPFAARVEPPIPIGQTPRQSKSLIDFTRITLLHTDSQIEAHAESLLAARALGLDTEFVRERTYHPVPGLLQFSDGDQVWLLDPIALRESHPARELLHSILERSDTAKILHGAGEDLEVLHRVAGTLPRPLFDTQVAAALLGHPLQTRYETLAGELLGVEFPGGLGRNDWTRRPLPADWIEYACNDVIALPAMRELLAERLDRLGRLEWLMQDCERMLERFTQSDPPILRVKGAAGLNDEALARAAAMAEWREQRARERDLPRGFIASDALLLELARQAQTNIVEFCRATPPHRVPDAGLREELLEIARRPPQPFQRPPELEPIGPKQRARIKKLQAWVGERAAELGIEPAVLASRRDLTRLVQNANSDCLRGWRGEVLAGLPL